MKLKTGWLEEANFNEQLALSKIARAPVLHPEDNIPISRKLYIS